MSTDKNALRQAAGKKLLEAFDNNKLQDRGMCLYRGNGEDPRPCAVGCLMTPEERDAVVDFEGDAQSIGDYSYHSNYRFLRGMLNHEPYDQVAAAMPNLGAALTERTGLTTKELVDIQMAFDNESGDGFVSTVKSTCGIE